MGFFTRPDAPFCPFFAVFLSEKWLKSAECLKISNL